MKMELSNSKTIERIGQGLVGLGAVGILYTVPMWVQSFSMSAEADLTNSEGQPTEVYLTNLDQEIRAFDTASNAFKIDLGALAIATVGAAMIHFSNDPRRTIKKNN